MLTEVLSSPFMLRVFYKTKLCLDLQITFVKKIVPVINSEAFFVIMILRVELWCLFGPTIKALSIGICHCLNTVFYYLLQKKRV